MHAWERGDSRLANVIAEQTDRCLEVYSRDPKRVQEDANSERRISEGGYHTRQLEELLQNATDAARHDGSRVEVVLTRRVLYVANDGQPFTEDGLLSIMASDLSTKDGAKVGRFGIGFKSVLAVSDAPKIVSRSVAFGFDRDWSENLLRGEGYKADRYPVMRLAQLLDPMHEAERDAELRGLMDWASTVVVIPLKVSADLLSKRLNSFPAEFILFSSHITRANLRNMAQDPVVRAVSAKSVSGGLTTLTVGSTRTVWRVVSTMHSPSREALADGGYSAERDEVSVSYAVRIPPGKSNGSFWAYFPTGDETTLSGIVNAPWKLSEDRLRVLSGRFNGEILRGVVPKLIGTALQAFEDNSSPGDVLDVLPARGREARSWADRTLSGHDHSPLFDHLRTVPSLPDGTGQLQVPSRLKWPGELESHWLRRWAQLVRAPREQWVHPDLATNAERALKIRRLLNISGAEGTGNASVAEWLEALVHDRSVEGSAEAIQLAAYIADDVRQVRDEGVKLRVQEGLMNARIVRFEDGTFGAARRGRVFVRVPGESRSDVSFVDRDLAAISGVKDNLARLGVVVMDRTGELHRLLARAKQPEGIREPSTVWPKIWEVLRDIPSQSSLTILREDLGRDLERLTRVRTAAGTWVSPGNAFLSGALIPTDGSRDRDRLIDPAFHRQDDQLLREIGAVAAPTWRYDAPREPWVEEYDGAMRDLYVKRQVGKKVDRAKITVKGTPPAWPLQPFVTMSEAARVAVTSHIIARGIPNSWKIQYATNRVEVYAPEVWFLRRHGLLKTAFGNLPPRRVLRAHDNVDPRVLPAVEASDAVAEALGLQTDVDVYSEQDWLGFKAAADRWVGPDDDDRRAEFYSWLVGQATPDSLVVRVGPRRQHVKLENIGVTFDRSVYESMIESQIPVLFAETQEDYERFTNDGLWGLKPGADLLQEEIVAEPSSEAEYLVDLFPPIKVRLAADAPEAMDVRIQSCSRLVKMLATPEGQRAKPISFRRDGDTIMVTAAHPRDRLVQVAEALNLALTHRDIDKILDEMERRAANRRRQEVKSSHDDDDRLLKAVGVEALRRIVPAQALEALSAANGILGDRDIAGLARAVHGVGILKQLKGALDDAGLEPPREWSGRRITRQWVASLGFPADWAGFPSASRPPVEIVDGPVELGELHGYQVEVTHRIAALLRGIGPDRGMVSLPTGAGKTRVTVQALVDGVHAGDIPTDVPLVWIAQTDELCEQAAETWTAVWRSHGPRIPMRLGRLWSGNEIDEELGSFQLVVATIDKLDSLVRRNDPEYTWLQTPSVVVIDEAHTSVATSYTTVLEWLGRTSRGRRSDRKPLIGLTATPFRGNSKYETERLVSRYDNNRLDRGAFRNDDDSYGELQSMGVLAEVRHELIDGVDVEFSEAELARMAEFGGGRLPTGVETRLGERLERTRRIADHMAKQPNDWTMLAFAPSVENARVLAALLSHRGIAAVSVSHETDTAARRYYVEEFKAGRIRVITNYNILTQGFDAPKVRAVYVGRPTFSPNVYQQMVGRGLRGRKNGGLDEVLIVNVKDNFMNYGEQLAFTEFEYLWSPR